MKIDLSCIVFECQNFRIECCNQMIPFEWLPSWEIIKKIGGSRTVALAGLFPFVGYLVVANDQFLEWTTLIIDAAGEQSSARRRMEEIYFALVWLSAGVILYKIFCPKEVATFGSQYDFSARELEVAEPVRLMHYQKNLASGRLVNAFQPNSLRESILEVGKVNLNQLVSDAGFFPDIQGQPKSKPSWLADSGREIALCLNTHYDSQNYSRPILRAFTLTSFAVGYVKLSMPAYDVLILLLVSQ